MQITIIGTGYVGLGAGVCLAHLGHQVACLDIDKNKIAKLKKGVPTIHEERLPELLKKGIRQGRLKFTASYNEAIENAEVVFFAVGTPMRSDGSADLQYLEAAAVETAKRLKKYTVLVNKSTVPVGTGKKVREIVEKYYRGKFDIVSNPEFQREGTAINDFLKPDRIVVGFEKERVPAKQIIKTLYKKIKAPMLLTNIESAEMIKYAANAFLATKISFINEIANICDNNEANIDDVAHGMGMDKRIGSSFLKAGIGYGGSCFPKDVSALYKIAGANGYWFRLIEAVININKYQREKAIQKITKLLAGSIKDKNIAVLGLSFKAGTDDTRESPSIEIIKELLKKGAKIKAYDPQGIKNAKHILGNSIQYAHSSYTAARAADLLFIATEWPEFENLDLKKLKRSMRAYNIVDGRNLLNINKAKKEGFEYLGMGR